MMWPDNRPFAFTIFDDTDWATVATVKPVYDLLADLGFRTTKSVWMFRGGQGLNAGETCEDEHYLRWILTLQKKGFEIALHNAAHSTSRREISQLALDRFEDLFGYQMPIHCNHTGCLENLYWGEYRLSSWRRQVYCTLTHGSRADISRGHVPGDALFWGDICQERIRYVRNFVFDGLNTLALCPEMPYHDPTKPFVNYWFASADGGSLKTFLKNFTPEAIDKLVEEGGLCVAYVHFGGGFAPAGKLDPQFAQRMTYIAQKGGWFQPTSTVLDYLRQDQQQGARAISHTELERLETAWLMNKMKTEASKRLVRVAGMFA